MQTEIVSADKLKSSNKIDYRFMLTSELESRRQKNPSYSLRAFARDLDVSAAYLSQIFSGKRDLSESTGVRFAQACKWTGKRRRLFLHLIQYQRADSREAKATALAKIEDLSELNFLELKQDQFRLVSDWYHFAIAELVETKDFQPDAKWIAKRLRIDIAQVEDAIERLLRVGLLRQTSIDGQETLVKSSPHYRTGDVPSEAIRLFHRRHLQAAEQAIENQIFETRDFSGTTVSIDPKDLPEIKELIRDFRSKLNRYCESRPSKTAVYQLAVQFFRLDNEGVPSKKESRMPLKKSTKSISKPVVNLVLPLLAALMTISARPLPAQARAFGGDVGNGGDAVECQSSSLNPFNGYYSLDYLAQYQPAIQPVPINTVDASFDRIQRELNAKLPELAKDFANYRRDLFNQTDFTRPHIWDTAAFGLVDLQDEFLVTLLPENCRAGDKVKIVQAVIRQQPKIAGLPEDKINYKFVPLVVDNLKKQNPLQLSFLLVHEWLWNFSKNVERNRRINYWLHSGNLEKWSRDEWIVNLHGIGFTIPQSVPPVWEPAVCERDSAVSSAIFDLPPSKAPFIAGEGSAFERITTCDKVKGCSGKYFDATKSFQSEARGPVSLVVSSHKLLGYFLKPGGYTASDLYFICDLNRDGTPAACSYTAKTGRWVKLEPTVGRDCTILRGRIVRDDGTYNSIEEYAFYFPKVTWSGL